MPFPEVTESGVLNLKDGGRVRAEFGYLSHSEADALFDGLLSAIPWKQRSLKLMGRTLEEPRLTCWLAGPGHWYEYTGSILQPDPFPEALIPIMERLRADTGHPINSALANMYRDGSDGVGWHADNERFFPPDPPVVSLTLGQTRRFLLRHRKTKDTLEWHLGHGDLLVMEGATQRHYVHSVPKTKQPCDRRINLTFRCYLGSPGSPR